jgi:hypothetical protein
MNKQTSYDEYMIRQCLYFIRQTINKYPDKKQLRFAIGYIEFFRGEQNIGRQEMEEFISLAQSGQSLIDFVNEGRVLLSSSQEEQPKINQD